jgi:hypothetical protein
VGLRAGQDRCGKSRPPPGFDPRTVQPAGSRYTDYATRPTGQAYRSLKTSMIILTMHVSAWSTKISKSQDRLFV